MWISKGEYRRLLRLVRLGERRSEVLFDALMAERASNREAERHWANMLLRAKQTYPLQPKPPSPLPVDGPPLEPASEVPGMDPGEVEALVEAGSQYGVPRADVIRTLKQERGL